ncbi:MAG: hypothetical protein H7Y30_13570 [Pyrinomonadaceae bacterium]|nr:hypothetical protein [Pyrinomonadaceae bacterium]
MKYALHALLPCALLLLGGLLQASPKSFAATEARPTQQGIEITANEAGAMKSLRKLLNAENAFQNTRGKGEYGELKDLLAAGYIESDLASGVKDGYRLTLIIKKSTLTSAAAIDLIARPVEYGKSGRRSFYLTEGGVMHTSDVKDVMPAEMRPFANESGGKGTVKGSGNEANEAGAIAILRTIHAAEVAYHATTGEGKYGTLEQLEALHLLENVNAEGKRMGYNFSIKAQPGAEETPASFTVTAVPAKYGETGRKSFFIDVSGIVVGADKNGAPADANDPPIQD